MADLASKKKSQIKFKRVKALRCYDQVVDLLYAGYPLSTVANFIQKRMKESTDITHQSMIVLLSRFRSEMNTGEMIKGTLPRVFSKAEQKFSNKMQELERLEDQYQMMQFRLDVAHGEERLSGEINPNVDKVAKSILGIIDKMHAIKMDLGLIGSRDLGTITVSAENVERIKEKYGSGAARAFEDPVSRGRVLAALNAMRKAGRLRDKDGNPLDIENKMNLSDEERGNIIDAEFEETVGSGAEDEDLYDGSDDGEDGEPGGDFMPQGEDFSEPMEDMTDETVVALDPAMDDEEEPEEEPEEPPKKTKPKPKSEPKVRHPDSDKTEMEPVRRPTRPNMPPGPAKPSVRGNIKQRTTSTQRRKKDE